MSSLTAQARYATLGHLGVSLWVPRKRLPNAAPSPQCDWPAAIAPLTGKEKLRAALEPAPSPSKVEVPQPASKPAAAKPAPPEVAVAAPEPLAAQPARVAPLSLDVWLLANGWQLVIERPQAQPLTPASLRLLQNLLAALYPGGMGILSQHAFHWPLPGVPVERGDREELNLSLRAFLTGAQFQQQPVGILALGQRTSELLSAPTSSLPLPEVYTGPDLHALLSEAAAKRHFWQEAGSKGLRARFASSPVLL